LKAAAAKSHIYDKKVEDPRIFPFETSTAYSLWRKALNKAKLNGKDKSTNRERIHPHVLRKFFRTRLGAVIPVDVVEALMGHEGYLTEVYRRYSLKDLKKFYLKGESALLVYTEAAEVTKLRQEVDEKNKTLQTNQNRLLTENFEIKEKMAKVESENIGLKDRLVRIEKAKLPEAEQKIETLSKELGIVKGRLSLLSRALDIIDYAVNDEKDADDLREWLDRRRKERDAEEYDRENEAKRKFLLEKKNRHD